MSRKLKAPIKTASRTGSAAYAELCAKLINKEGHHYLYPKITRTRAAEWMAYIYTCPDKDKRAQIAVGQGLNLEGACAACVADFHERQRIEIRKEALLKNPIVQEALKLFKV